MKTLNFFCLLALTLILLGCSTVQSSQAIKSPSDRVFRGSFDEIYSKSVSTLMGLNWQLVSSNKEEGLIQARTPATIWTWGDVVTVYVVEESPGNVRVEVTSATGQQFDWGKNTKNIEVFYVQLNELVSK